MNDNEEIINQIIAEGKLKFWGETDLEMAEYVQLHKSIFNLTQRDFLKIMTAVFKEINQIEK